MAKKSRLLAPSRHIMGFETAANLAEETQDSLRLEAWLFASSNFFHNLKQDDEASTLVLVFAITKKLYLERGHD